MSETTKTETKYDAEPQRPRTRGEFLADFLALSRAIDNVLVAHYGLRSNAPRDFLSLDASLPEAVDRYGAGSVLFNLWNECQAVEKLRTAWTSKASTELAPVLTPVGLVLRLYRALELTKIDAERAVGTPYGDQAISVLALKEAARWLGAAPCP